jgi:ACS family tartrate transporter-like MFS transporter
VEGLPAVLMSLWFWMALPDSPATAEWLSAEEREALRTELVRDSPEHGSSADLKQVLLEPRVWVLGLFAFCMLGMNYAVSYFLPLMLNGIMHWSAEKTGYCIAAGGVAAAVAMVAGAAHSDRTGERRWHIVVPMLIGGGLALLAALVAGRPGGALPAALALLLFLVPYCAMQGPMLVMASKLCPGKNAALAVAVFNMCGICGGFVGPYWMGWMRELMGGYATGLGSLCVPSVVGAGCILWLTKGRE